LTKNLRHGRGFLLLYIQLIEKKKSTKKIRKGKRIINRIHDMGFSLNFKEEKEKGERERERKEGEKSKT